MVYWYVVWKRLARRRLPPPVHFAVVASLSMFALLPLLEANHPISMLVAFGGGLSFAILTQ